MIVFGGNSRQSLAQLRSDLDGALKAASAADCKALAADLFASVSTADSSTALRRALTDPSRGSQDKASLVRELFAGKLGAKAVELIANAATLRWSKPSELSAALEQLAVEALASGANVSNEIDQLQSELFAFENLVSDSFELRQALSDAGADKDGIISDLLGSKFTAATVSLIKAMIANKGTRSVESALEAASQGVLARRNRVNAIVTSSVALTAAQQEKLTASLTREIGQPVHLNLEIDKSVIGGVQVLFKDEIIDGTIAFRLEEAKRALIGA
jgi:F-type H+-transporting ATPase subunit delta